MTRENLLNIITTSKSIMLIGDDDVIINRNDSGLWIVKTFLGNLLYDDIELCDCIREGDRVTDVLILEN